MTRIMTMTLQAAGLADHTAAASVAPPARFAHVGRALRRAVGFAITAGGFAVIAVHLLSRVAAG
jgi:hypothetical protein